MAFTSKFVCLIVTVLFCLVLTQPPSDQWNGGHGCFYAEAAAAQVMPTRKVLQGMMHGNDDQVVSGSSSKVQGSTTTTKGWYGGSAGSETWDQLRGVPAGPDPLHHHGGSPKKPRTP